MTAGKPVLSPAWLVLLLIFEAFFLTYIYLNAIDLVYVIIIFGITVFLMYLLIKIGEIYGTRLKLIPDADDNRSFARFRKQLYGADKPSESFNWKQGVPIWSAFVARIVLTLIFVIYDLPLLFLFIFAGFLDYLDSKFIALANNNTWKLLDFGVRVGSNFIIFYRYIEYIWVTIAFLMHLPVLFAIVIDLDYYQLKAFIPDVLAILAFYNDPIYHVWVLPIAVGSFVYDLYYHVLYW